MLGLGKQQEMQANTKGEQTSPAISILKDNVFIGIVEYVLACSLFINRKLQPILPTNSEQIHLHKIPFVYLLNRLWKGK